MGDCVIGIVLESVMEPVAGYIGIAAAELNLPLINQSLDVARIRLEDFTVELGRFVQAIFQNQKLNIILFDLHVAGMCAVKRSVFRGSLIQVSAREVEVTQHPVAFALVPEIVLVLLQKILDLRFLAIRHHEANQSGAGRGILWFYLDGMLELLFSFSETVLRLVEAAQG